MRLEIVFLSKESKPIKKIEKIETKIKKKNLMISSSKKSNSKKSNNCEINKLVNMTINITLNDGFKILDQTKEILYLITLAV